MSTDKSMDLRPGLTCADCYAFGHCSRMGITEPSRTSCDWYPIRFSFDTRKAVAMKAQIATLLSACESGLRVAKGHAHDCNPHGDLKPGESADCDAATIMVELFEAAISAKGA